MNSKKAFTLIELLVVISIIAVLMAIMMPALGRVKKQAERLVCNTHLKDMGNLVNLYAADNEGKMVTNSHYGSRWYDLLGEYYGGKSVTSGVTGSRYDIEIFKCPVEWKRHKKNLKNGVMGGTAESIAASSMYAYNGFFMCPMNEEETKASFKQYWYSRLDKVQAPSALSLYWDRSSDFSARSTGTASKSGFDGDPHMSLYAHGWDSGNARSQRDCAAGPAANHENNINALFADGHAESKGLWMYKDTLDNPEQPNYYWKFFHPLRLKDPASGTGDGWHGENL